MMLRPKSGKCDPVIYEKDERWMEKFKDVQDVLMGSKLFAGDRFVQDRKTLALIVVHLQNYSEDLFGKERVNPEMVKIPVKQFKDFRRAGGLCKILRIANKARIEYKWESFENLLAPSQNEQEAKTTQGNEQRRQQLVSMFLRIEKKLVEKNLLIYPRIYLDKKSITDEKLYQDLVTTAKKYRGTVVNHRNEASHIVVFDEEVDGKEPLEPEHDYLRTLQIRKDLGIALVHWWYYPDSYDEWIPINEIEGQAPEPDDNHSGPWTVCCRFVKDVDTFHEWGNEIDYEIVKGSEPQHSKEMHHLPQQGGKESMNVSEEKRKAKATVTLPEGENASLAKKPEQLSMERESQPPSMPPNAEGARLKAISSKHPSDDTQRSEPKRMKKDLNGYMEQQGRLPIDHIDVSLEDLSKKYEQIKNLDPEVMERRSVLHSDVKRPSADSTMKYTDLRSGTVVDAKPRKEDTKEEVKDTSIVKAEESHEEKKLQRTKEKKKEEQEQEQEQGQQQEQQSSEKSAKTEKSSIPQDAQKQHEQQPSAMTPKTMVPKVFRSRKRQRQAITLAHPECSSWFRGDAISSFEKRMLPEFFDGRGTTKTPEIYMQYRSHMINQYKQNPNVYLTSTKCRRELSGDVCAILRVHEFLDKFGLINHMVDSGKRKRYPYFPLPPAQSRLWPPLENAPRSPDLDETFLQWSEEETERLLQAFEKKPNDWIFIRDTVGTDKSMIDCLQKFLSISLDRQRQKSTSQDTNNPRDHTPTLQLAKYLSQKVDKEIWKASLANIRDFIETKSATSQGTESERNGTSSYGTTERNKGRDATDMDVDDYGDIDGHAETSKKEEPYYGNGRPNQDIVENLERAQELLHATVLSTIAMQSKRSAEEERAEVQKILNDLYAVRLRRLELKMEQVVDLEETLLKEQQVLENERIDFFLYQARQLLFSKQL